MLKLKSPEQIARELVDQFSWSSNVMRDGRLVGQQHIVAEAVAAAIQKERDRGDKARRALVDTALALNGLVAGNLKPKGRKAAAARTTALETLQVT